ncbi:MAG: TadE/TadG family type IV pilus assembly protein [Candidatus Promineifilaceae bacterium]|nr:TadE/TadG family type IV pilus assembly protein [Candidatus Promineifilaceae bacterium]
MFKRKTSNGNRFATRGQAIVEFAIALPILLALLIGIFEVGRLIFIYSAVTNSSRNAVRFASAVGLSDGGYTKFNYCEGIKDVALKSAYLVPASDLNITIVYDSGPGTSQIAECNNWNATQVDTDVVVSSGDRVTVSVSVQYRPMLRLIPIGDRTIVSTSSRTILGIINLGN